MANSAYSQLPLYQIGSSTNPVESDIANKTIGMAVYAKTSEASTGSSYAARFHLYNAGTGFGAGIMAKGITTASVTSRDTYGIEAVGIFTASSSLASGAAVAGGSFTAEQAATADADGWLYCIRLADNVATGKDATAMGRSAVIGYESAGEGTPINRLFALEVAAIGSGATTSLVTTATDHAATHAIKIGVYEGDTNTPTDLWLMCMDNIAGS